MTNRYSPDESFSKAPVVTSADAAEERAKKAFLIQCAAAARVGHEGMRSDYEDDRDSGAELPSVPTYVFLQGLFGLDNFQSTMYQAGKFRADTKKFEH